MADSSSPIMSKDSVIDRSMVAELSRETGAAVGLPASAYYKPEAFEQERERIFAPSWIPIAFKSDVPNVGDIFPVSVAGWELLVVRGEDDVKVFHNFCRHRGLELAREAKNVRSIVCGYHCWSYDLDGNLKGTPNIGGIGVHHCEGIDRSELGLVAVRSGSWSELIFVNMDGLAPPLSAHLAPINERLSRYDMSVLKLAREGRGDVAVNANWKIFIEAGIEDYHLPYIHPKTLVTYAKNYTPENGGASYAGFSQAHSIKEAAARHKQNDEGGAPRLPNHAVAIEDDRAEFIALFIFPLGTVIVSPTGMSLGLTLPQAPDRTLTRNRSLFIGSAAQSDEHRVAREEISAFFTKVVAEDIDVMETLQRSAKHRDAIGMRTRFSGHWEKSLHQFQSYYAERMAG